MRRKGNFNDVSNECKVIVFREEFPVKKGFLMVNVHNSKTRILQNKDSTLQKIVQHIYFVSPCCGVAISVRNYHDVTP